MITNQMKEIQKKIISARAERAKAIDIMDTVNDYMKKEKFANVHRRELMAILERKLNINPKVKLIDIFPDHHDYKLFFANSFSLKLKMSTRGSDSFSHPFPCDISSPFTSSLQRSPYTISFKPLPSISSLSLLISS